MYHVFFPLSLPVVVLLDGITAAANFQFLFINTGRQIVNSYIVPLLVWATLLARLLSAHTDPRLNLMITLSCCTYAARISAISLKYALLSAVRAGAGLHAHLG